ncbi:hypothetical protein BH20ACT2_BH20ACT2_14030 [soil metagenome]
MTTVTIDRTLARLRRQAGEHGELAEALEFLADATAAGGPFGAVEDGVASGVSAINRRRLSAHRQNLRERSLTTAQVVALVESISDRKGVDRRRQRGRLLAIKDANVLRHPIWQFDNELGESRTGLDRVLAALTEVTPAPDAADALMTTARPDLGGGTLADRFADGDVALVVQLIRLAADQS